MLPSLALAAAIAQTPKFNIPPPASLMGVAPSPDFDKEILAPLRAAQAVTAAKLAAEEARKASEQAELDLQASLRLAPVRQAHIAPQPTYSQDAALTSGLIGSIGYAQAGGNCVLQIPPNMRPNGNPSTWEVLTGSPYVGAVALFSYNHTGMVVGIWGNGDLEIAHQNFTGGIHRFPRGSFRGFR